MTWTRTPQEFPDRADVLAVSRSARWLLIEMYSWSNAQLTDGRVPRSVLRRISDAEDPAADVAELLREGLLVESEAGFLFLDWTDQESAETVRARMARNAEKTKRARERKERHLAGDHSICVAPYCKLGSPLTVTGNTEGNATGNAKVSKRGKATGKVTGGLTPNQSSPVQSVRSKGLELDRAGASGSAGAPPTGPASERLNAGTTPTRHFQGVTVTPEMTGGVDPNAMSDEALEEALLDYYYPEADGLDGLIPAGGAGR